jgi:hypothetical protein
MAVAPARGNVTEGSHDFVTRSYRWIWPAKRNLTSSPLRWLEIHGVCPLAPPAIMNTIATILENNPRKPETRVWRMTFLSLDKPMQKLLFLNGQAIPNLHHRQKVSECLSEQFVR